MQGDPAFLSVHADGVSQVNVLGGAYVMPEDAIAESIKDLRGTEQ